MVWPRSGEWGHFLFIGEVDSKIFQEFVLRYVFRGTNFAENFLEYPNAEWRMELNRQPVVNG